MATIRIGTQGWNYEGWVGPLYPRGTRPVDFLSTYARAFSTVEVDSTFYANPSSKTIRAWSERVPRDFVFALKMPREITHDLRLRDALTATNLFIDRARELGDALGPVLIQMGPDFSPVEFSALEGFLSELPHDMNFAIELRNRDWISDQLLDRLAEHNVALALSDGRWIPRKTLLDLLARPTANFLYLRWMGPDRSIEDFSRIQVDRSRELEEWAVALATVPDSVSYIYGYVNNHFAGHSPESARQLQRLLGQTPVEPSSLEQQMTLF
jgi:uncharacterized protein YecE (DUF72 family)